VILTLASANAFSSVAALQVAREAQRQPQHERSDDFKPHLLCPPLPGAFEALGLLPPN